MKRDWIKDRLITAVVAAFFGALVGLAAAWIISAPGKRDHTFMRSIDVLEWMQNGALFFGFMGLAFGASTGTFVGWVIKTLFETQHKTFTYNGWIPNWVIVLLVAGFVAYLLWP